MANVITNRKSGFITRSGVRRRQMTWLTGVNSSAVTTLAAGAQVLFSSLNAAALALRPFTIVRTRGLLSVFSDQQASSEVFFGAAGDVVVTEQATGVGITAVPVPMANQNSDWFWFEFFSGNFRQASAVGIMAGEVSRTVIDSKAMRKVDEGDDLATIVDNGSSTTGINFLLLNRTLIKLH